MEKMLASHISEKESISLTYKGCLQLNLYKRTSHFLIGKGLVFIGKYANGEQTGADRCSAPLSSRDAQIKTQ